MKFNFKKISAVTASLLMVGMTAGVAAAAAYPAPFVSNGVADVAVVYGTGAGASDMVPAGDVQENLGTYVTSTGVSVSGDGDTYKFEKASTKFHLGDNFTTITSVLDDDELSDLLADGIYVDDDNDEFDYTQKIEMNTTPLVMFDDNDYQEDAPTIGFKVPSGTNVLNYTLTFSDQPLMADLLTSDLPILGKEYYVLSNSSSSNGITLTLLDSADSTILTEGESVTTEGKTVSIAFVSSTEVKLIVDGQTTNTLEEGETQKLSDGSYIGVKDILYNSKDTGVSSVEFSIGSGKLELISGSEIQINDETINGVKTVITNTSTALTSIEIDWSVDDDTFITEDTSITLPGFGNLKVSYAGLNYPTEEEFTVEQGSSTYIQLNDFKLKDGSADIPLLYGASGAFTGLGKDSQNRLVSTNDTVLHFDKDTDAQFVVTYESASECESYLLRATSFGTDSSSNNVTTLQMYQSGAWENKKEDVKAGDTFSIGQADLGISVVERSPVNTVKITANSSNTKFNVLCSAEGLKVWLPFNVTHTAAVPLANAGEINFSGTNTTTAPAGNNNATFYLQMQEEDKDDNVAGGDQWNVSLGWDSSSTQEPQVSDVIGEDVTFAEIGETDVFRSFMYSALATEFLYEQPTSQDSVKIIYHGGEVTADVYVSSSEGGVVPGETGVMLVTDAEVSSVAGKNLIIVGGSCVNSAAAQLVGGSYCESDWTTNTNVGSGEWIIKSYPASPITSQMALLVAGYEAADTQSAVTYLINNKPDTSVEKIGPDTTVTA